MEKEPSRQFMDKVKEVAQGPDANLLYGMVELLYERQAEYDNEPLSDSDWAAIREEGKPSAGENLSPWRI
jgi:hypothetical protein